MNKLSSIFLIVGLIICAGTCYSQEEKNIEQKIQIKEILGRLSSRSPIDKPEYIGVIVLDAKGEDSGRDMFFSVDKDLKISHKKKFSDIQIGDIVKIVYDEITQTTEEGEEKLIKRVAKTVKFVRSKKDKKKKLSSH